MYSKRTKLEGEQSKTGETNTDGVHGKAVEWDVCGIHMECGAGQMNTVFSCGTCRESGIITNCGKAKIN